MSKTKVEQETPSVSKGEQPIANAPMRPKIEFKRRSSYLDPAMSESALNQSEFRGFWNLIIVGFCFFFFTTQFRTVLSEGTLVGWYPAFKMFNRYDLFPAWLCLVGFSMSAFVLQKAIAANWLRNDKIAMSLYWCIQGTILGGSLFVLYERNWPVVQSSFYFTEFFLIMMKIHSYIFSNREFAQETKQKSKDDSNDKSIRYPANVTLKDYIYFLLVPTLVYQMEYPRTERIRLGYLLEKLLAFGGCWACMHTLVWGYIIPVLFESAHLTILDAVSRLIIPFTVGYLLIFYMVFEVFCNAMAELTRFADRKTYDDWWNSTTWDEFARKWNRPVHEWLLRHIYFASLNTYKTSKLRATSITFLFSSIFHELFMTGVLRVFMPWLFFLQMFQLPLIMACKHPIFKKSRLGNMIIWFGLMLGPPLLGILYCREYIRRHGV
mmetsp:Transcript_19721/g.27502  ORF Transcript_19721/g.27502 Transcript_19721/m.27502 type:complete len:436 (+) Transcript_19721:39-1346(+)